MRQWLLPLMMLLAIASLTRSASVFEGPRSDLAGMHPIAARQLRHRAVLSHRRQRNLRLEIYAVLLANIRHLSPLARGRFRGETLS
jgi:hypothetical protein